jgi:hypothetical protein
MSRILERPSLRAGLHPLEQIEYLADIVDRFEIAAADAASALGDTNLHEGVRAAGFRRVCSTLVETATMFETGIAEDEISDPSTLDLRARWSGLPGRLQRLWQGIDAAANKVSNRIVKAVQRPLRSRLDAIRDGWWLYGLLIAVATAGLVVSGNYPAAALLLVARWLASLAAGGPMVIPPGRGFVAIQHKDSIRRHIVTACAASHLADLVVVGAAAVSLAQAGRTAWALATMAGGTLASFATLLRLAAERNGVPVRRSVIERFARNGGTGLALVIAAATGASSLQWPVPSLSLAGAAFAAFAAVEIFRVIMALCYDPETDAAIMIAVRGPEVEVTGVMVVKDDAAA